MWRRCAAATAPAPSRNAVVRRIKALDPWIVARAQLGRSEADRKMAPRPGSLREHTPLSVAVGDGHSFRLRWPLLLSCSEQQARASRSSRIDAAIYRSTAPRSGCLHNQQYFRLSWPDRENHLSKLATPRREFVLMRGPRSSGLSGSLTNFGERPWAPICTMDLRRFADRSRALAGAMVGQ